MNHQEAKETILRALPTLSFPQRLVVQGISALETKYGNWGEDPARGAGSNNMGAVTDPSYRGGQANDSQFLHEDSRPATPKELAQGSPSIIHYITAFRKYPSPEAGFKDVARTALKANVNAAIADNDLYGVSQAMYDNVYYTGVLPTPKENIDAHFKNLNAKIQSITKATGDVNPFQGELAETIPPLGPESTQPLFPRSLPLPSSISQSILRIGSVGFSVKVWQKILGITVDGIFGRKTDVATRVYQSTHHLKVDGIVGPKTWQSVTQLPSG